MLPTIIRRLENCASINIPKQIIKNMSIVCVFYLNSYINNPIDDNITNKTKKEINTNDVTSVLFDITSLMPLIPRVRAPAKNAEAITT